MTLETIQTLTLVSYIILVSILLTGLFMAWYHFVDAGDRIERAAPGIEDD